ncbi:response regulator transcription factor [Deinococcus sp.]|uniref:response regulator transcription factor n=1 Tax=Deinococcus sp. TaxID=47478 RepID=UPI003C7B4561
MENIPILCGVPALAAEMQRGLDLSGFTSPVEMQFIIDAPPGFALSRCGSFATQPTLVLTDNTCIEYLMDLRQAEPTALLAGGNGFENILAALANVAVGESRYRGPELKSCLTHAERQILKNISTGRSDKEIAKKLDRSTKTVGNQISSVLNKLNLKNRTHAIFYYFALDHLRRY